MKFMNRIQIFSLFSYKWYIPFTFSIDKKSSFDKESIHKEIIWLDPKEEISKLRTNIFLDYKLN